MIISLVLASLAIASGTITTYYYDEGASFPSRLCAGACIGLAGLGLIGFAFASFLGLTSAAIVLTAVVLLLPFLAFLDPTRKENLTRELVITLQSVQRSVRDPSLTLIGYFLFYAVVSIILWQVFSRAMMELPDGLYTGLINNFGDLPFHLSVITSFAYGNNFPPEDPTYAGVRFTYPFLSDFVSAIFVQCGASLRQSMFIENYILAISLVGLLHRWALAMVKDRLAAVITPLLVLLNGGFGWVLLWAEPTQNNQGWWERLKSLWPELLGSLNNLAPSYTVIPSSTWRWGNALSALLVPQRGILMGLPLAVIVFTQWWLAIDTATRGRGEAEKEKNPAKAQRSAKKASRKKDRKPFVNTPARLHLSSRHRMIAAGIVAGMLPLVHAHSFVVVMAMGGCLALIQRRWRDWFAFFIVATLIAVPQMLWSTHGSSVKAASFFAWQFGWDRGTENAVWFWFKNTGLFIPLIVTAILWRGKNSLVSRRVLLFYLPFTLCFIIPNLIKLAPWVWDNIKVLFYWWVASAPLVAMLLARLWHQGRLRRLLAVMIFACVTLAGALDVASIVLNPRKFQLFDPSGIQFAELVKRSTDPRALVVHAPVHNDPIFLTGRRSLLGYPGHIWTHGLDFVEREREIKSIYAGAPNAEALLRKYGIAYAVVGPHERNVTSVNDQFFSRFAKVGEIGEYRLYKITQP
ncbi:MAG: hypothetical protein ACR2G5_08955 [Pyrinomonadaceae bacterium]